MKKERKRRNTLTLRFWDSKEWNKYENLQLDQTKERIVVLSLPFPG